MTQKVLKVGSSAAVTIPKKSLKELGFAIGDEVKVHIDAKARKVTIELAQKTNDEVLAWTDGFVKKYRTALRALSKK